MLDGDILFATLTLPSDYTSFNSITWLFTSSDTTSGHTVVNLARTYCVAPNTNTTPVSGPSYNTATSATTTIPSSAAAGALYSQSISSLSMTGCVAGGLLRIEFSRGTDSNTAGASDALKNLIIFAYNGSAN